MDPLTWKQVWLKLARNQAASFTFTRKLIVRCTFQSKCFAVIGRVTRLEGSKGLNLCSFHLISLNLCVEEAADIPLEAENDTSCLLILTGCVHLTKSKEMLGSELILWIHKDTQNSFCNLKMHIWNLPKRSAHRNTMVIAEAVPSNIRSALQSPVVLVSNNTTTIFIHIFINDNFSSHLNIFHCLY